MKRDAALKLRQKAEELASIYSEPDREQNYNGEKFILDQLTPLGENLAVGVYKKSTGKKTLMAFVYVIAKGGYWMNFVPTSGHILGLEQIKRFYFEVEEYNFDKNG